MKPLRAPHAISLPPVRANVGVRVAYERELVNLIRQMHEDMMKTITSIYPDIPGIAQGAPSVKQLHDAMEKMAKEWRKRFEQHAKAISEGFATGTLKSTDFAFRKGLQDAGFTVKFQMPKTLKNSIDGIVSENVGLIKSIASEHLSNVQGAVIRSVNAGRSMKSLTEELGEIVTLKQKKGESDKSLAARVRRRAAFIARDQNNKATAMIHRARQKEMGIEKARWIHSNASVHPREEHAEWSDEGRTYNVDEGMWSDVSGEFVWPGSDFNCGCVSASYIPGFDDKEDEGEEVEESAA